MLELTPEGFTEESFRGNATRNSEEIPKTIIGSEFQKELRHESQKELIENFLNESQKDFPVEYQKELFEESKGKLLMKSQKNIE